MINIYVSNLSYQIQDDDLRGFFEDYGQVKVARVVTDRETGRSRGFGFVEMDNREEGLKAIAELNGAMADGRALNVNEARPREERAPRSNYGGGGGKRW